MKILGYLPTKLSQLKLRLVITLFVGILLLIVFIIGAKLGWWVWLGRVVMASFNWVVVLLLTEGVIIGLLWFFSRYPEKRFFKRLRDEGLAKFQTNMAEAMRALKSAPGLNRKGQSALYALPWYVLIGAGQCGKTALLQSVTSHARLPATTRNLTPGCDWWFFKTSIIFDTASSFAFPPSEPHPTSQWVRFLQLLRHYRELQPINGLIVAVALDALAPQAMSLEERVEKSKAEAEKLRKQIDETSRELSISCPVYLMITRCDVLEGFTEFFSSFPETTFEQIFGYVHPTQSQMQGETSAPPRFRFEPIHTSFVERLQALRSAIFYDERPMSLSRREKFCQQIYCFPAEFRLLQKPLSTFVETLFDGHPSQSFYFRGIFIMYPENWTGD